jgi:hypothetical protein
LPKHVQQFLRETTAHRREVPTGGCPKRSNRSMMEHQMAQVIKICNVWQRATRPRHIVGAFQATGLVPYPGKQERWYLKVEESEATQLHSYFPPGIHLDNVVEYPVLSATLRTRGDTRVRVRLS